MSGTELDVVFIGGGSRSGSTLLLRMLGAPDQYVPIGELTSIWEQHFQLNRACGCGNAFRDCDFWNAVMDDAFGGIDAVDADQVVALRESVLGLRNLPKLMLASIRPADYERRTREYVDMLEAIYRAIRKVTGCQVIVDSSKRPAHAWAMTEVQGIRPTMVLLVRDSRACAYSWRRKKRRIDVHDQVEYMKQHTGAQTTMHWVFNYSATPLASPRFARVATCRYEDLVEAPARTLERIVETLGLPGQPVFPFISDKAIDLKMDHSLWGNPMRAEQGVITIRPDSEWMEKMPAMQRGQVTLMTLPWLIKYRYPLLPRRADPSLTTGRSNYLG